MGPFNPYTQHLGACRTPLTNHTTQIGWAPRTQDKIELCYYQIQVQIHTSVQYCYFKVAWLALNKKVWKTKVRLTFLYLELLGGNQREREKNHPVPKTLLSDLR